MFPDQHDLLEMTPEFTLEDVTKYSPDNFRIVSIHTTSDIGEHKSAALDTDCCCHQTSKFHSDCLFVPRGILGHIKRCITHTRVAIEHSNAYDCSQLLRLFHEFITRVRTMTEHFNSR